jgi:hypothetical protein
MLDQVVGFVRLGLAAAKQIVAAVQAGRAKVRDAAGQDIQAEQLEAAIDSARAKADAVGTAAADRIEDRHAADGTGQP